MEKNTEYQNIKKECEENLESRKTEFNQMKRDIKAITDLEIEIKANLDQAG